MNKKQLFKILSVLVLLAGLIFIVFALIALFNTDSEKSTLFSALSAPLMFLGVFLFALGFGKDTNAKK